MPRCKEVPESLWEQQPGESVKAFEAFSVYRNLGVRRSTARVAQQLGKSKTLMDRWSSQWFWVERVRAYDRDLDKKAREQAVKDVRSMTNRHIRIAMKLQERAVKALEDLPTEKLTPKLMLDFLDKATKLERYNRLDEAGYDKDTPTAIQAQDSAAEPAEEKAEGELDIDAIRRKMDEMTDEQLAQYEALCDMFRGDKEG
jgi:hypothetical protein